MPVNQWAIRAATGEFLYGGFYTPVLPRVGTPPDDIPDPAFAVVTLPDEVMPNLRTQKWSGIAVVTKTAQEILDYDAAQLSARSFATSRDKDILATCANIVRARGIAAWNALTPAAKVAAALAEADIWKTHRDFIEDKV